jgi:hypothetical protein
VLGNAGPSAASKKCDRHLAQHPFRQETGDSPDLTEGAFLVFRLPVILGTPSCKKGYCFRITTW